MDEAIKGLNLEKQILTNELINLGSGNQYIDTTENIIKKNKYPRTN